MRAERALVTDASDRRQIREARLTEAGRLQTEKDDLRAVMSSVQGRRFMWRLLALTKLYETSFTGNSTTFFNEGMRNIGLVLLARINDSCPDAYLKMIQEENERKRIEAPTARAEDPKDGEENKDA